MESEMKKELVQEMIASVVAILLSCFTLVSALIWIIDPDFDVTGEEELITNKSQIVKIEKEPGIFYSSEVLYAIHLKNGRKVLIIEDQLYYMEEEDIGAMKPGDTITYKVSPHAQKKQKNFEAEELSHNGKTLYDRDDYNGYIQDCRKTGWLLAPIGLVGIILFAIHFCRCIETYKLYFSGRYDG